MNKKSSSQSAFFNFRVLLLLCAVGALVVLAAFGARPGGSAKPQPSAQDQNGGLAQPGNNNLSPSGPGLLPRQRASSSSFNLMEAPASDGATVTTDKADYAPGETVVISGTGWTANQEVALHIDDSNGVARWDASVTADGAGNISNSGFVIQSGDVGLAFTLTATQGAVTAWTQFTDVVGAGVAPNGDPGGFEIDGNLRAGNATPVAGGTDWLDTTSVSGVGGLLFETGIPKNPLVTGPASGPHIDPANCGSACDDVFTGGSGGPNDNPSTTWFWQTGASNDKTDMNNAYFHISTSANGHRWITASGDRFSTNGTAYIDFELLQQTLTRNVQTGCVKPPCGNFTSAAPASTGGRTVNDLLVTAAYGNGGTVATLGVSQWRQVSPGVYQYVDVTNSIPNNTAFVATSLDPNGVPVPYGAFGVTPGTYVPNQFVEFSIDLTALLTVIGDPCEGIQIKTLMVKTKTSTALTATLEDMLPPFQISFSAGFIVSATGTSPACSTGFGTVTGTFSGGIGPFECQLDDGSFASCTSPVTYNNVGSGSHTVTVKDDGATGCQKTSDAVIITIPSAVTASSSPSPILCHGGSSTVTVSATGGTGPYSGTGTFTRSAGTYSFTVTDANSCTDTTTGNITQPTAVTLGLVKGCNDFNSGFITATFGGGTPGYQCSLDGGPFGACTSPTTFNNLSGPHSVTVRDTNLCSNTQQITVDSCQGFCALTQGAYGNAGGIFTSPHSCYNNLGTLALIRALLGNPLFTGCGSPNPNPQSLIVGILGTRSLTIPLSAAQCIITRLPAGGPPSALPNFGDKTLQNPNSCQVSGIPALPLNNGRFYNVLLGQTITLGLNLRLDPTLANVDLAHIGTPVVINGKAYRQFCTQSGGNIQTWRISQAVINALSNSTFVPDPTHRGKVSGLLDLANRALAGLPTGAASISDINAAVNAINSGFDECRMLVTCPIR